MQSEIVTKISARMWSQTASLKPIASRLGEVALAYDKGDDIHFSVRGKLRTRRSRENYLSTEDVRIVGLPAVRGEVARQVRQLQSEPAITRMIDQGALDAVVWVAVFGDEGAVRIDDLPIDRTPFGKRIGLVVENYAEFDGQGIPRKLLIGPAATRKST